MSHTFLLKPGVWKVKGQFFGNQGEVVPAEGETKIFHRPDEWAFDGKITLLDESRTVFTNQKTLTPPKSGESMIHWRSNNAHLGALLGKYLVVGDTLVSHYRSEDGRYHGHEHLLQQDAATYHCSGAVFDRDDFLSAWNMVISAT